MASAATQAVDGGSVSLERRGDVLIVRLAGTWRLALPRASAGAVETELAREPVKRMAFEATELDAWDTGLVSFVRRVVDCARMATIEVDLSALPPGVQRLIALADAAPEHAEPRAARRPTFLARVGTLALRTRDRAVDVLVFLGETSSGLARFATGRARLRMSDVWLYVQQAGAEALPIVTLLGFLVGTILAFVGAVQLQRFGASIYVADMIGLSMTREMGAVITAIIVCGRTGASYAAQLGTMKVTEEIDALATFGIPPTEFLVVPRVLALVLMIPCLCLYADLVGILGGAVVARGMLDVSFAQYFEQLASSVTMDQVTIGVVKSAVFGVLVALAGCYQGMRCGTSAAAVGEATTKAVVIGIVLIVAADGIMAVMCNVLGL